MSGSQIGVGVDVGGTTVKGLVVTREGEVLRSIEGIDTPTSGSRDVAAVAADTVRDLLTGLPADTPVGVCVPGIVDEAAGVGVFSANLGWRDAPLRDLVSERLGRPVALGHDVRSGALGEAVWGLRIPDCLYVAIGTGIASGLILGGRPAPAGPWSGEIGQVPVNDPDRLGERVALERIASAAGICRRALGLGLIPEGGGAKALQDLAESARPEDADDAARARAVYESSLGLLADVIAIVVHQVGTVPVVIGGGLSKGGDFILDPIRERLVAGCAVVPAPPLLQARLGSASQAMGAAALAFAEAGAPVLG